MVIDRLAFSLLRLAECRELPLIFVLPGHPHAPGIPDSYCLSFIPLLATIYFRGVQIFFREKRLVDGGLSHTPFFVVLVCFPCVFPQTC